MAGLEHDRVRDGAVASAVGFVAGVVGTVLLAGPADDTERWEFTVTGNPLVPVLVGPWEGR